MPNPIGDHEKLAAEAKKSAYNMLSFTKLDKATVNQLLMAQYTLRELAAEFGRTEEAMRAWIEENYGKKPAEVISDYNCVGKARVKYRLFHILNDYVGYYSERSIVPVAIFLAKAVLGWFDSPLAAGENNASNSNDLQHLKTSDLQQIVASAIRKQESYPKSDKKPVKRRNSKPKAKE